MVLHLPFRAGRLHLDHRIVMAPLTRCRAHPETLAPTAGTAAYYRERATGGGLLVTEAIHISAEGTPVWDIYDSCLLYTSPSQRDATLSPLPSSA